MKRLGAIILAASAMLLASCASPAGVSTEDACRGIEKATGKLYGSLSSMLADDANEATVQAIAPTAEKHVAELRALAVTDELAPHVESVVKAVDVIVDSARIGDYETVAQASSWLDGPAIEIDDICSR